MEGAAVLITGAATGLGAAVAELAASRGAKVAVLDVNEAAGRETARRVGGLFIACDVADPDRWREAADEAQARLGPIRYAHLNAGVMTQGVGGKLAAARFEAASPQRYRAVMGVNLDGVVYGLMTLLPRMTGGAITVTSSAAGLVPIPFDPIYAASKHALVGLVRSLAEAGGPVRINALCPGGFVSQIVPDELANPAAMSPADLAAEVLDLLLHSPTGEIRLKLRRDAPAEAIPPPPIALLPA